MVRECPFQVGQRVRFADIPNNQDMLRMIGQCGVVHKVRPSYSNPKEWLIYVEWEDENAARGGRYSWRFEAMDGPW